MQGFLRCVSTIRVLLSHAIPASPRASGGHCLIAVEHFFVMSKHNVGIT